MMTRILVIGGLLLAAVERTGAADCARLATELVSSSQPQQLRDPGAAHNIFDGPDDHAIYYGAADWLVDEDTGLHPDGVVDLDFGMIFGNAGTCESCTGWSDRQVKQVHEYRLAPAYAAGIDEVSLASATIRVVVDRVMDFSLSGQTDLLAPEFVYVKAFVGDGLLTTLADAQADFNRCDRTAPATWDVVHALLSPRGFRLSQDEVDFYGGHIIVEIDVTEQIRSLLAGNTEFAGFTLAGSELGDFVLLSVDGGDGSFMQLPRLILSGPFLGDFDQNDTIDLLDFSQLQACFSGMGAAAPGCAFADLDQDGDVDAHDGAALVAQLTGPNDPCSDAAFRSIELPSIAEDAARRAPRRDLLGDFNGDGALNAADRAHFHACLARAGGEVSAECAASDLNHDGRLDASDGRLFGSIFNP